MRYYYRDIKKLKISREDKKEVSKKLTALDKAILGRAKARPFGSDIYSLISACRPFKNRYGSREFAPVGLVRKGISKLVKLGLLEVK